MFRLDFIIAIEYFINIIIGISIIIKVITDFIIIIANEVIIKIFITTMEEFINVISVIKEVIDLYLFIIMFT